MAACFPASRLRGPHSSALLSTLSQAKTFSFVSTCVGGRITWNYLAIRGHTPFRRASYVRGMNVLFTTLRMNEGRACIVRRPPVFRRRHGPPALHVRHS